MNSVVIDKKKRKIESIVSSLIFICIFGFFIWLISYLQMTEEEKMPVLLYIFFIVLLVVQIIGIIYNLIIRIKEINGGEEDEASKY